MKTIQVDIKAQFKVPDDWAVVEYVPDPDFPDDVRRVLKIGDKMYDFFPECLVRVDDPDMVIWSADEGRTEDVIDCMDSFQVEMREDGEDPGSTQG